jgi:hypothetical protein
MNWPNLNRESSGVILVESETCVALSPTTKPDPQASTSGS